MPSYALALRRFWWLLLIGAVVAGAAGYYLATSDKPTYQSSARILVTSGEGPYFRTSVQRLDEVPVDPAASESAGQSLRIAEPDTKTLVQAANLYPLLIESDDVARLRAEMFGDLRGDVTAQAIGSTVTLNRFEPGEIPVVQITGTASGPRAAVEITRATTSAFISWIEQEQDKASIAPNVRILIQQLTAPGTVTSTGGASMALPILGALAIFVAFGVLAILLDRLAPRVRATWRSEATAKPSVEKLTPS